MSGGGLESVERGRVWGGFPRHQDSNWGTNSDSGDGFVLHMPLSESIPSVVVLSGRIEGRGAGRREAWIGELSSKRESERGLDLGPTPLGSFSGVEAGPNLDPSWVQPGSK